MEAKTVYVVTQGDYSDYHIVAIYSTEEEAEKHPQGKYDSNNIEEWQMDAYTVMRADGKKVMFGRINKDGKIYDIKDNFGDIENAGEIGFANDGSMYAFAIVKDKEGMKKVLSDTRAQYLAENKWGKEKR